MHELRASPGIYLLKVYFGEIKNELVLKERGPKSCSLDHLADSSQRQLKRKLLSIPLRKHKIRNVRWAYQELKPFKKSRNMVCKLSKPVAPVAQR